MVKTGDGQLLGLAVGVSGRNQRPLVLFDRIDDTPESLFGQDEYSGSVMVVLRSIKIWRIHHSKSRDADT